MEINATLVQALEDRLTLHDKMKGSYFYSSPGSASSRRSYEKNNSRDTLKFVVDGKEYTWKQTTDCSCRNVYYKSIVTVDGDSKDVRAIKSALRRIASNVPEAFQKAASL